MKKWLPAGWHDGLMGSMLLFPLSRVAQKAAMVSKCSFGSDFDYAFGPLTVAVIFASAGLLVTTVKRKKAS